MNRLFLICVASAAGIPFVVACNDDDNHPPPAATGGAGNRDGGAILGDASTGGFGGTGGAAGNGGRGGNAGYRDGGNADSGYGPTDGGDAAVPTLDGAAAANLSDAEILRVLVVANAGERTQGALASTKATNADVKAFAMKMVTDHQKGETAATALAQTLGITPAESDVATGLQTAAASETQTLQDTPAGSAFDRAYMQGQVTEHAQVLGYLTRMEQAADAVQLRTLLVLTDVEVRAHLESALRMLDELPQ